MLANHSFKDPPAQEVPLGSAASQIATGTDELGLCVNMEWSSERDV